MPSNPLQIESKIKDITNAWESLRPTKTFAGLSLEQFKLKIKPSADARATIADLDNQLIAAHAQRDTEDKKSLAAALLVVNSVKGDPDEGEDGALYEAMGYVRKSDYKSGLHREKPDAVAPATAAH